MCKALNKDLEERKIDSWWQWIYNFVRNWQRKSDKAKTPYPLIFFYASLWIFLDLRKRMISRIFFLRQNLIFQTLSSVCMFTLLRKKNEGNFRVTACMIKTRSLSKWSHLLEISKGGTIRFKIGLIHSISVFERTGNILVSLGH